MKFPFASCELAVLQVFALKDLDSAKFDRCLDIELLICEYQFSAVVDLLSHLKCSVSVVCQVNRDRVDSLVILDVGVL